MNNDTTYRMPAEWERQTFVQLTWPHKDTDWAPMLEEITATYVEMAREITRREPLLIVVPSRRDLPEEVLRMGNTTIVECPTNDTWARDHGFITLVEQGARGEERGATILLDFKFNGWGEKFEAEKDNAINKHLWESSLHTPHSTLHKYESHLDFVLEGGSIESDGKGTIFTTTSCLLAPHRNEERKEIIEQELLRRLRAQRIVWLDCEQMEGDDTDGHIDTMVRLAPNDTILYNAHAKNIGQLRELRTLEGKPYRLIELPLPEAIYEDGEQLPATYANFLILNGAVLVPTYGQPENDAEALRLVASAFPDREIVGIDSCSIIKQHGSIHCCTMQYY
jgi:agmatine/peptidylarginine deiminase